MHPPGRPLQRLDVDDDRPTPRPRWRTLAWALALSLLINHALLVPMAHLALWRGVVPPEPTVLDLEVAPVSSRSETTPRPEPLELPRTVALARLPEPRPPDPQPQREPEPQPERPTPVPRLKMVETNTPETDKAPDDARFLSDKNRQVERETRARHANSAKSQPRPRPLPAKPKEQRRTKPGEEKPRLAQSQHSPTQRKQKEERRRLPLLRMRQTRARRRSTAKARPEKQSPIDAAAQGDLALSRASRNQRLRATQPLPLRLGLDHRDYDRIQGEQAHRERRMARLRPSKPSGRRHQRKWERIRSALENFIPEVQPGNQTALGTRADPFAVFIARMHRQIHNYWGFGFLVDLDAKPDGDAMNDMGMWTMVEIVVDPSGEVGKATLVRSSGVLTFDTAALDTVYSAAPYPHPPRAIRSADGNVYLHWRFHRDQRQCGTFGVDPYILTKPPTGPIDGDLREVGKPPPSDRQGTGPSAGRPAPRRLRRLNRVSGSQTTARRPGAERAATARSAARHARAAAHHRSSPLDPGARAALRKFFFAFAAGDPRAMAASCAMPFISQGRKVARSPKALAGLFGDLLAEASSREIEDVEIFSLAAARRRLGYLPRGVRWGETKLVARARLGGTVVTLVLAHERRTWKIVGLDR